MFPDDTPSDTPKKFGALEAHFPYQIRNLIAPPSPSSFVARMGLSVESRWHSLWRAMDAKLDRVPSKSNALHLAGMIALGREG